MALADASARLSSNRPCAWVESQLVVVLACAALAIALVPLVAVSWFMPEPGDRLAPARLLHPGLYGSLAAAGGGAPFSCRCRRTGRSRADTSAACRRRCSRHQESAFARRVPERLGFAVDDRRRDFACVGHVSLPLHDQRRAAVPRAERAAGAVRQREVAVLHLHRRMRLAAQLAHRLDHLGHAAAIGRMVVAQPAAVGVERQLADAGDQIAVGDELAALRPSRRSRDPRAASAR